MSSFVRGTHPFDTAVPISPGSFVPCIGTACRARPGRDIAHAPQVDYTAPPGNPLSILQQTRLAAHHAGGGRPRWPFRFTAAGQTACERQALLANGNAISCRPAALLDGIEKPLGCIHDDRARAFASVVHYKQLPEGGSQLRTVRDHNWLGAPRLSASGTHKCQTTQRHPRRETLLSFVSVPWKTLNLFRPANGKAYSEWMTPTHKMQSIPSRPH
jgi:hypothetical protein